MTQRIDNTTPRTPTPVAGPKPTPTPVPTPTPTPTPARDAAKIAATPTKESLSDVVAKAKAAQGGTPAEGGSDVQSGAGWVSNLDNAKEVVRHGGKLVKNSKVVKAAGPLLPRVGRLIPFARPSAPVIGRAVSRFADNAVVRGASSLLSKPGVSTAVRGVGRWAGPVAGTLVAGFDVRDAHKTIGDPKASKVEKWLSGTKASLSVVSAGAGITAAGLAVTGVGAPVAAVSGVVALAAAGGSLAADLALSWVRSRK